MMKRFLQLLTAGTLVLLIAACGDNGDSGDDTTEEEETDTEESTDAEDDSSTEDATEEDDSTTEEDATEEDDSTTEEGATGQDEDDSGTEDDATEADDSTEEESSTESDAGSDDSSQASDDNMTDGEEETKTFVAEGEGMINTLVYTYVDDRVLTQTSETTATYEALGYADEESARAELEPVAETYADTEGIEHSIEYTEDGIVENLEVDYEVANIADVADLEGAEFEGDLEQVDFISMTETEEALLNNVYELQE